MSYDHITIIPDDGAVYVNGQAIIDMDLSECNIPEDVHALQYHNGTGEIETKSFGPNIQFIELPQWAVCCVEKWKLRAENN